MRNLLVSLKIKGIDEWFVGGGIYGVGQVEGKSFKDILEKIGEMKAESYIGEVTLSNSYTRIHNNIFVRIHPFDDGGMFIIEKLVPEFGLYDERRLDKMIEIYRKLRSMKHDNKSIKSLQIGVVETVRVKSHNLYKEKIPEFI